MKFGRASGSYITSVFGAGAASGWVFGFLVDRLDWGGAVALQLMLVPLIAIVVMFFVDLSRLLPKGLGTSET